MKISLFTWCDMLRNRKSECKIHCRLKWKECKCFLIFFFWRHLVLYGSVNAHIVRPKVCLELQVKFNVSTEANFLFVTQKSCFVDSKSELLMVSWHNRCAVFILLTYQLTEKRSWLMRSISQVPKYVSFQNSRWNAYTVAISDEILDWRYNRPALSTGVH